MFGELVVASKRTNSYKIFIFGLGAMPSKQNPYELRVARIVKNFLFKKNFSWISLNKLFTKFLKVSSN
jgi:hypothetical protein